MLNLLASALQDLKRNFWSATHDLETWIGRLSDGERTLGLVIFALVLLFIVIRRPRNHKQSGGMARQFIFAFFIVFMFAFGANMLFDGFDTIGRHIS